MPIGNVWHTAGKPGQPNWMVTYDGHDYGPYYTRDDAEHVLRLFLDSPTGEGEK